MISSKNIKIIKIFQSGNFSLLYVGNGECWLYDQKGVNSDTVADWDENALEPIFKFDQSQQEGYEPYIVTLMTLALGGESDSY